MNPAFPQPFRTPDGRDLVVYIAESDDSPEIANFLMLHSLPIPPIRQLCGYQDGQEQPTFLLDIAFKDTEQPMSLLMRDTSGELVAVLLNDIHHKSSGTDDLSTTLLIDLYDDVDLFDHFKTDKIFHQNIVAVSSEYGRQGLAKRLYQLSLKIAEEMGFEAASTEAASSYTAKLANDLGYITLRTMGYISLEHKGTSPFSKYPDVLAKHPTFSLMARRIPA